MDLWRLTSLFATFLFAFYVFAYLTGQAQRTGAWGAAKLGGRTIHSRLVGRAPSVALYTFNLVGSVQDRHSHSPNENQSDITIDGNYYWLYFALISRLYNPQLKMTAIVDRYQAVSQNTAVHEALQSANIKVVPLSDLSAVGSRYAQLLARARPYYDEYWRVANVTGRCYLNKENLAGCDAYVADRMVMLARFCAQADLANREGVDFVIAIDADIMVVANLLSHLQELMEETQVLTFVEWSSQFVVFKRAALDSFCDAMVEHTSMPPSESSLVFEMGNLLIHQNEWTDMTFLAAFLRVMRPDLSRTVLCGTPTMRARETCPRLSHKLAVAASFHDGNCSRLGQLIEWRKQRPDSLPELWTKGMTFRNGELLGTGERVPMIHFQGSKGCKAAFVRYAHEQYVGQGLVPNIGP